VTPIDCPECEPCGPCEEILHSSHVAVLRALEFAGKRMVPRTMRASAPDGPAHLRHTVMPVDVGELDRLLLDVWDLAEVAMPGRPDLISALDGYARELLYAGTPHELGTLRAHLRRTGILPGPEAG
jgi:hypothetical protein